jgi:hypothetical protein
MNEIHPGDDERLDSKHPAHYEIAWAACILNGCKIHETPKRTHKIRPGRSSREPIVQPITADEVHGWKRSEKQDLAGYARIEPGPLLPIECVLGRAWYHCPHNKCPKHVQAKINTKYWPTTPKLKGTREGPHDLGPYIYVQGLFSQERITALVDSGATRNFVSKEFVELTKILTKPKKYLQIVQTIEGNNF